MTIFQHTSELVTSGAKTQTRRLWKPEWDFDDKGRVIAATMRDYVWHERVVYYVGQQLAVQPGRGKPAIARIEVLRLWREDVRDISRDSVMFEGFTGYFDFWCTWTNMHDVTAHKALVRMGEVHPKPYEYLRTRPAERYDALAIEFRLLEGGAP